MADGLDGVIRPCAASDAEALVEVFREAVRRTARRDYSEVQVRAWAPDGLDPARFSRPRIATETVVAEMDGRAVGFVDLEADGHVDMLYVHPDYAGRGLARRLMDAAESQGRAAGVERLYTEASVTARPAFERFGFVVLAAQSVEFNGETFLNYRMEKRLGS